LIFNAGYSTQKKGRTSGSAFFVPGLSSLARRLFALVRVLDNRGTRNGFLNETCLKAVRADFYPDDRTSDLGTDLLDIRFEFTPCNSGSLDTDSAFRFGEAAPGQFVAELCLFSANFANSTHLSVSKTGKQPGDTRSKAMLPL
jgi:hypothetical protein